MLLLDPPLLLNGITVSRRRKESQVNFVNRKSRNNIIVMRTVKGEAIKYESDALSGLRMYHKSLKDILPQVVAIGRICAILTNF